MLRVLMLEPATSDLTCSNTVHHRILTAKRITRCKICNLQSVLKSSSVRETSGAWSGRCSPSRRSPTARGRITLRTRQSQWFNNNTKTTFEHHSLASGNASCGTVCGPVIKSQRYGDLRLTKTRLRKCKAIITGRLRTNSDLARRTG